MRLVFLLLAVFLTVTSAEENDCILLSEACRHTPNCVQKCARQYKQVMENKDVCQMVYTNKLSLCGRIACGRDDDCHERFHVSNVF